MGCCVFGLLARGVERRGDERRTRDSREMEKVRKEKSSSFLPAVGPALAWPKETCSRALPLFPSSLPSHCEVEHVCSIVLPPPSSPPPFPRPTATAFRISRSFGLPDRGRRRYCQSYLPPAEQTFNGPPPPVPDRRPNWPL